jgi:hypothetical protein
MSQNTVGQPRWLNPGRLINASRRSISLCGRPAADAGQVTLDVGGEDRHAHARVPLGEHLKSDGLAGAGGARHQAVPIAHGEQLPDEHAVVATENDGVAHGNFPNPRRGS